MSSRTRHQKFTLSLIAVVTMAQQTGVLPFESWAAPTASAQTQATSADLKEFKTSGKIYLRPGQSRLFSFKGMIKRTYSSSPAIVEPVVFAENTFVVRAKEEGRATIAIWSNSGSIVVIDVNVRANAYDDELTVSPSGALPDPSKQTALEFQPAVAAQVKMEECRLSAEAMADYAKSKQHFISHHPVNVSQVAKSAVPQNAGIASKPSKNVSNITIRSARGRIFRSSRKLIRVDTANNKIADAVLISDNEFAVSARDLGTTAIKFEDDAHNVYDVSVAVVDTSLTQTATKGGDMQSASIPPVVNEPLRLFDYSVDNQVDLDLSHPKIFTIESPIIRSAISNPEIAELVPGSGAFYLVGKKPGTTTLFIWGQDKGVSGMELRVHEGHAQESDSDLPVPKLASDGAHTEMEAWHGSHRDTYRAP